MASGLRATRGVAGFGRGMASPLRYMELGGGVAVHGRGSRT